MGILYKVIRDIVIIVVLAALAVSGYTFFNQSHPVMVKDDRNPSHTKLAFETIDFKSTDDKALKGWFIPATNQDAGPKPTIVVAHGLSLSKAQSLDWSYYLADQYNLFLFDFRGHGESAPSVTTYGDKETKDLIGAVNYVASRNDVNKDRIGVFGYDMGASAVLLGARDLPNVKAIVADSPRARLSDEFWHWFDQYKIARRPLTVLAELWSIAFRGSNPYLAAPADKIESINQPIFLIGADGDEFGSGATVRAMKPRLQAEKSLVWTVAGSYETLFSGHRDEYKQIIRDFFKDTL
ncbi:MAG: alpha/beta fold hydrolase [Patescibacteria group bacterium]|jgi:pimeloyl-ACP methyl ester carboxylesterase